MSTNGFVTFESVSRFSRLSEEPKNAGYTTELEMGIGAGIVGDPNSAGTIGGYLREKSKPHRIFAVTAHHVVSQKQDKISLNDNVQVESPAGLDLDREQEWIDKERGKIRHIEDVEAKEREVVALGAKRSSNLCKLRETKDAIDIQQQGLETRKAMNRTVGTVFASSGLRTVTWQSLSRYFFISPKKELNMDWALIELNGARPATNSSQLHPSSDINGDDAIAADSTYVQKVGRITGHTLGQIDGYASVSLNDVRETYEMKAVKKPGAGGSSFVAHGDSGAWILDMSGNVLGMIIGGDTTGCTAFYTPIDMMLHDMEKRTGLGLEVMK